MENNYPTNQNQSTNNRGRIEWGNIANNNKSGIGVLIVVFGTIFLLIGVTLSFYEIMLSFGFPFGGYIPKPHLFTYPYQFVGLVLILAGIIFLIIGIYLWLTKSKNMS